MDIREIDIDKLNIAIYNPRKNLRPDDKEYARLEKSIDEFGYVDPIIWNEKTGNVVGGHQRLKILIAKGHKKVSVSVVNLDDVKEKALNVALNQISGDWDYEMLDEVLADIAQVFDNLDFVGFDIDEVFPHNLEKDFNMQDEMEANKVPLSDNSYVPNENMQDVKNNNAEIDVNNFSDKNFNNKCPKCGFLY